MTRIVVTGAAGFIGSNLVRGLNARGLEDIIAVDDLTQGEKFRNLVGLKILDYLDADTFYDTFTQGSFGQVEAVFHQGACSDRQETNGKTMMASNYATSVNLFQTCQRRGARFVYASSADVYGQAPVCRENPSLERPTGVYGYSKQLFDQRMRRECGEDFRRALAGKTGQVVGLRYFDVYGGGEQHKGRSASVVLQCFEEFLQQGHVGLATHGAARVETCYDLVTVEDVVAANLWFFDHPGQSGIFNVGTGQGCTRTDIAVAVANAVLSQEGQAPLTLEALRASGRVRDLSDHQEPIAPWGRSAPADLTGLRAAGCHQSFTSMSTGVAHYVQWLMSQRSSQIYDQTVPPHGRSG